jgi:hypothetical protein
VLIGLCRSHIDDFITAYKFGCRLKTVNGRSPYDYICGTWTVEPDRFTVDPTHQMLGLNTYACRLKRRSSNPQLGRRRKGRER